MNPLIILYGPSGSGKTTIAQLSKTVCTVINDEIIALRITSQKNIDIYGTPFWGEMRKGPAYNTAASAKALYFLKKDTACYVKALDHSDSEWFVQGEDLIRARAKADVLENVIRGPQAQKEAEAQRRREDEALRRLRAKTTSRRSSGRMASY